MSETSRVTEAVVPGPDHGLNLEEAATFKDLETIQSDTTASEDKVGAGSSVDAEDIDVCRFFARKGWCKFRKACRYRHEKCAPIARCKRQEDALSAEESVKETVEIEPTETTEELALENKESKKTAPEERSQIICSFFKRSGRCKFGVRCRFKHMQEKPPRFQKQDEAKEGTFDEAEHSKASDAEVKAEQSRAPEIEATSEVAPMTKPQSKKQPRLCRYFSAGHCSIGSRCRFWHPEDTLEVDASRGGSHQELVVELVNNLHKTTALVKQPKRRVFTKPTRYKLEKLSEEELAKLRNTDIEQLHRRYPKGEGENIGIRYAYQFIFMPTDPDWPFDVKTVPLRLTFPESYPRERLMISVPENDVLPETLRRHLRLGIKAWIQQRHTSLTEAEEVELMVRPLLHWLDRQLEDMFTEGLKKYQQELIAHEAGLEFIPASRLREAQEPDEDTLDEEKTGTEHQCVTEVAATDDNNQENFPDGLSDSPKSSPVSISEMDPQNEALHSTKKLATLDPAKHGTEIKLHQLQLGKNVSTLLTIEIQLMIQCERCKHQTEVTTPAQRINSVPCQRCHCEQLVNYRASLAHQFTMVIGYLDLQGCTAFDLVLSECKFQLGCLACSKDMVMQGLPPGQPKETWCHHCHQKIQVAAETARFHQLQPAETALDTSKAHNVQVKKFVRVQKDPAIQEGKALPNTGTCKHYKKSFRWLRFPCCGKAYPCDLCHDNHETDHEMKFANRMICGYCCREQAYASDKPCIGCNSSLIKRSTTHWEGGRGCRDKVKMSRDDVKKYTSTNKTVSRKAQSQMVGKKSSKT